MKSSTNRGGHNANPLFSAFVKALLSVMLLLVGNVAVKAQTDVKFNKNVRYSQWVLDSRLGDFKGNTNAMGFATYKSDLTEKSAFPTWEGSKGVVLDYVAGLVAKAAIENAIWYKDFEWSKPWFKSVESYANHNGVSAPTGGGSLDNLNGAKMYFGLYTLANDESYISETSSTASTALTQLSNAMKGLKAHNTSYSFGSTVTLNNKSVAGGWFHKSDYENQMWLDGQYMGPALLAQLKNEYSGYTAITDDDWQLIANQLIYVWEQCWDSKAQLLYHAFSTDNDNATSHSDTWAGDAEIWTTAQTDKSKWKGMSAPGHSAAFWGRAEGWYFLALVDVLEQMKNAGLTNKDYYQTLTNNLKDLAAGIAKYQNKETGCWYQLIAKDGNYSAQYYNGKSYTPVSNYLESSCTAIFTAAYLKAMRLGFLDTTYESVAKDAYAGLVTQFMKQNTDGTVHLVGCCKSAGLGGKESSSSSEDRYKFGGVRFRDGSNAYYLLGYDIAPTTDYTEGKVLGAFVMAATEYERAYQNQTENSKAILLARDLKPAYSLPKDEKISIEALGSSSVTYQWYKDGSAVAGATESSFVPTESGSYYCVATPAAKADGVIQSSTAEVTVEGTTDPTPSGNATISWTEMATTSCNADKDGAVSTGLNNIVTPVKGIVNGLSADKNTTTCSNNNVTYYRYTNVPASEDANIYFQYSYTVEDGYIFTPSKVSVSWSPANSGSVGIQVYGSSDGTTYSKIGSFLKRNKDKIYETDELDVTSNYKYIRIVPYGSAKQIILNDVVITGTLSSGSTEPTTYTVTYDNKGHGTAHDAKTVNKGYILTPNDLPTLIADGYTFGGWYTDAVYTTAAVANTTAITENTTLYAKWTINKYTVTPSATNGTISINGTDVTSATSYDYGTELVFKATPADGYEFESWTVEGTLGTESDATYTIASLDNDTKVTANFKEKTTTPTVTTDETINLLNKKSSYTNTDGTTIVDVSKCSYSSSNDYIKVVTGNSFTVESNKTIVKIILNYTGSGYAPKKDGAITVSPGTFEYNTSTTSSTWTGSASKVTFTDDATNGCDLRIASVQVFYAVGPTYKVTYHLNGHGTLSETEKTGLTALPEGLPPLTETGWTFGGWYTDNGTFEKAAVGGATISEDTELYAKWTRNTYTVTTSAAETSGTITVSATDADGNAITGLDLTKVEHGTKLVFTANAKGGYVFSSWTVTGATGTTNGNTYTIESLTANTEVKANFKSTSAPTDGEICHFTGNTPSQSWTTVSGSYKTLSTGVEYKGATYTDVVKMESSTAVTVNSSETQTAIFVFDAAGKVVKIDGVKYTTDKDGLVTLDLTAETHTLTKGDVVNLVAIELVSNIAPEQDSRATFTYNNAELPFYEIKEGENTVHVAEIVLMKSAGVTECEVSFETAEGAKLRKQGETDPLTSPIKVTAPTSIGEQSSYYTVTSNDGSSTTTYKITIKVIDQKRKIVLKYNPATFEWDAETQGKVTTDAFKTAWNANKPVLKAYLADESGNATTTEITPLPVGITYTPDIAGIVNVDASGNLNVIPGADGGVFVYAKLSNSAEYEESNEASCNVIITQGYGTVKLKKGEAAPKVNDVKYITANGENLVKITFGGWKYGKLSDGKYDHSYLKPGDETTTVKDEWDVAKGDDKGELASIDGHKYGWPGKNDAANEDKYKSDGDIFGGVRYGWFKSPELDADGKVTQTYPFTLPVRGTYATFEPQMNGTLTVYIIQNGAWNTWGSSDGGKSQTTNDGQTYKSEAFGIKKGEFRPHSFHVVNQRGLTLDQFATSWSVNTKQSVTSDYYCNPTDKTNSSKGDLSPNVADWGEFNDGRLTEKEKQDIVDAWKGGIHGAQKIVQLHDHSFLAIQKGVVKYTFHVTGHETYYFFSNFSKMGFCGARFVPDEAIDDNGKPMQPVADLELSDTKPFPTVKRDPVEGEFYDDAEKMPKYIYKYNGEETINGNTINIEGGVQAPQFKTITMNRTFKKGQWTTLSLPFNITQSKVEEIFGVGTQLLLLDKATITNGNVKLHFLYHEIQNVLPGYPYLIKPTFKDAEGNDYSRGETAERTIDADGNLTRFVVPVKHINPDILQQEIDCGDYVAKCVAEHYSTGELTNLNNNQTGYSVKYKEGDIFISEGDGNLYISNGNAYAKGYRSYIEKKQGTQSVKSISMTFSGVDDGEYNTPTEIKFAELAPEAAKALGFSGVYNLNGQYVGDTTENLPAGVYIANGRKVVIK